MLSGVALRAQIASVIDALSKAAVAEISKVVEDGMVVLRMEVCQREDEIKKLKSSVEVLHNELRAARKATTLLPDDHRGADESQSHADDKRNPLEKTDESQTSSSVPEVQVKCEPAAGNHEKARRHHDKVGEEFLYEAGQWRPRTQSETACSSSDNLTMEQRSLPRLSGSSLAGGMAASHCSSSSGGFQQNPLGRGLLGFSQHRNTMWRRTVKRLMFKKGFVCPYCGKCFERSGHLERHKRIHTGEKPYLCEICGRQFNQKCSLKEHMKIHRRYLQSRPGEIQVGQLNQTPEVNPHADAHQPEDEGQARKLSQAEDSAAKMEAVLPTPVQVKSEPAEETITQPLFNGGNEKTTDKADNLRENFTAAEGNNQLWMSGLQNNPEMSGTEAAPSSSQTMTSFPALAQPLPPPVAPSTSCSSFSFPGKPYSELKNNPLPQMPYGSTDTLIMSSEAGLRGMPLMNHQQQRRSRSFQVVKPKKWFICSYCGKIFERAGHLERHLRIHTGEKPYGCHICGRCFNQKSSLKGHMRTHRNGEIPDVLEAHHLMFSVPDNQLLEKFVDPPNGQAAIQEQLPGPAYGDAVQEEKTTVKTEPRGEDFLRQMGADNSSEVPENIHLWTSSMEKSSDAPDQTVCILLQDVKYLSPTASEQQGYLSSVKDLAFINNKEKEAMMHSDQYSFLGIQPRNCDLTLVPEPHEVAVNDYGSVSGGTHEGSGLEFNMTASDSQEDNYGGGVTRQNGYICSNCGQSFDSFNMFQKHQCEKMPEQGSSAGLFSCEICGKSFNQMSILKLHLKLHVN